MKKESQLRIMREWQKQTGRKSRGVVLTRENAEQFIGEMGIGMKWQSKN